MSRLTKALVVALFLLPATLTSQGNSGLKGRPEANPSETRKYLQSLGWGDDYPADAVVEQAFEWGTNSVMVRIVPMRTANQVSWQKALGIGTPGGDGYFVAKIYNLEDKEIDPLGLGKLATGYLWVGEVEADGTRGARIYTIKNNGKIDKKSKSLTLSGFCPGQHPASRVELTDGKKCPPLGAPASSTSANTPRYFFASMTNSFFAGKGLWVTCLGGCCELQTGT